MTPCNCRKPCHYRTKWRFGIDKICIRCDDHVGEHWFVVAWEDHIDMILCAFLTGCLLGWWLT